MPSIFVLIWSSGFVVARFANSPPFSFLSLRFALSILAFLPLIWWQKASWPREAKQWLHLMVLGLLMHLGYLGGVWSAVYAGMGSGLAAVVTGFQPLLVAILLSVFGSGKNPDHQVSQRQWLGLLLGFSGIVMVLWNKASHNVYLDSVTPGNVLMVAVALLSITLGALYQKRFVKAVDVRCALTIQLAAAFCFTLPLAFFETTPLPWSLSFSAALLWSVFALTLGANSLLYLMLERGAATRVSSLLYLVPPTTTLMGWLFFGEALDLVILCGIALSAFGVALVVNKPAKQAH